jgi:DNA primase
VGEDVEALKRRLPLLDYLRQHNWTGHPASRSELVGFCPLHEETRPSFYVNTRKDVFYCHGCGQGGDLIRFVQLSRRLSFRQSLACLDPRTTPEADPVAVLEQAAAFYRQQLDNYPEALSYLNRRGLHDPILIKELEIGYAPGGSLRPRSPGARTGPLSRAPADSTACGCRSAGSSTSAKSSGRRFFSRTN